MPFFADDGFISLRYAERFLSGRGLTWTDGERVEGYSNLLWVLSCALTGAFGVDLVSAARALGLASSAATFAAIVHRYPPYRRSLVDPSAVASLFLALSPPMAIWAIGGLEQPLLAALLAWALIGSYGRWDAPAMGVGHRPNFVAPVCLGLLCWTRPDAPVLVGAIALGIAVAGRFRAATVSAAGNSLLVPFALWLAQIIFRRFYYREWVSNSTLAKVAFNRHRLEDGVQYLKQTVQPIQSLLGALLVLVVLAMSERQSRARLTFLLVPLIVWSAYVVAIGGDIFPAHRQMIPAIVILALMLAECAAWCRRRAGGAAPALGWIWAAFLAASLTLQQIDPDCENAVHERWEWDAVPVGKLFSKVFGDKKPLLAVDAAGALPYYSKLPAIDMLGINDRYLTHHQPTDFGTGLAGHELGDGNYLWSRKPDIVVFHLPAGDEGPSFRGGLEMRRRPDFGEFYQLVTWETESPQRLRCRAWIRKEDGVLGIERRESTMVIPGYLLASHPFDVARLDPVGAAGVTASADHPATLRDIPISAGYWRAAAEGEGGIALTISLAGKDIRGDERASFWVGPASDRITVTVEPKAALAHVHRVTLTRATTLD